MFSREASERLERYKLFIAYLLLALSVVLGFVVMTNIMERIEREGMVRAAENCESTNDAKAIIAEILDRLLDAPSGVSLVEEESRNELRDELSEIILLDSCPPLPEN